MEFSLDLPWPWSLSPIEALNLVTRGVLPSFLLRFAVGILCWLSAGLAWGGRGLISTLLGLLGVETRDSAAPFQLRGIIYSLLMGLAGWLLAHQSLLILAALFVVYFTLATYRGSARARGGRLAVLIVLRLLALLLTLFTVARPAVGFRSDNRQPSLLLIGIDLSESMTIHDMFNNQSREEAVKAILKQCEPILKELRDDHQITTVMVRFHSDVQDFDPAAPANGKRSDYGLLVNSMYERFGNEKNLRGFLIIGDGADNGLRFKATQEAGKFRAIQCPIDCFVAGQDTTTSNQKDLALTNLIVEPAPVYVKGRMTLRASVNAFGLERSTTTAQLFVDGKEVPIERMFVNKDEKTSGHPDFPLTEKNDFVVEAMAPQLPGEVRVTLKLGQLPGEVTYANNEISTYVTVIKEGVSVLYVDDDRDEHRFVRMALRMDPRFRLTEVTRQTDSAPPPGEADLFKVERQAYDVIILGNVSARRLAAADSKIMEKIRDMVLTKGVGFMMIGGKFSFGGSPDEPGSGDWRGTPIADLLPVTLDAIGHLDGKLQPLGLYPTPKGKEHYLLQIKSTPDASDKAWEKLNVDLLTKPSGMNRLAKAKQGQAGKPGAEVLATTEPKGQGEPVLVAQKFGAGRTLAFAMDTTSDWTKLGLIEGSANEGTEVHARFWKQVVLWLAQQENSDGNVWVKPDFRRIGAGAKQAFSVGVKGRTGMDLPGGKYQAKVIGPKGGPGQSVPILKEGTADRGTFWQTDEPGEYRIEVTGTANDVTGDKPVSGTASVRFLVFQDDSEMFDQSAKSEFMGNLAYAGGGRKQAYRVDELPKFLQELKNAKLPGNRVKTKYYPEWRRPTLTPFLPFLIFLFLLLLGLEWGLRRLWGMA